MLRTFQKQFLKNALAQGCDTAALSIPRGNGKTWLAAYILTRCLTPGDPLYQAGAEYLLCAASIEQARLCFRFIRMDLEPLGGYRFIDSATRIGITHTRSNTRLRVLSSNGKTAMGIVGCPVLVADEPGSWEVVGGTLMFDAIQTAQGKPGSPLRVIYIGTLAPASSGWWHDLIERGSHDSTYVQSLTGDREKWDKWPEIRRCNPLTAISPDFRRKLLEERKEALHDSRLKGRFLSFRLNLPTADDSEVLLTIDDWKLIEARPVPPREGRPIVAVDLGAGRAWSAAVAMWESGRTEALALAPGIPDLEAQEKRDRAAAGTYQRLEAAGILQIAEGLQVQPPALLWAMIQEAWGRPGLLLCDLFKVNELRDAIQGACPIETRRTRWSDSSLDIRALRAMSKDGPLSVEKLYRPLIAASLAASRVQNDTDGNTRMVKKGTNNTARDDVAAALALAAGAWKRTSWTPVSRGMAFA